MKELKAKKLTAFLMTMAMGLSFAYAETETQKKQLLTMRKQCRNR